MTSITLDNQFMKFWYKLNIEEKKSLLLVAKTYTTNKEHFNEDFVENKHHPISTPAYIEQSDFYTQDQITEMTRKALYGL